MEVNQYDHGRRAFMGPITSNPTASRDPTPAVFSTNRNILTEIQSLDGHVFFRADARTGTVTLPPDGLEDGPENARVFKSEDGRMAALLKNFDACLTVVLIDTMHHITRYDDAGNVVSTPATISPHFQFIALIRPLWKFVEDSETRKALLTFLELPRTLGPRRFYTRSERYQDSIDSLALNLPLARGAKVHDTAAGPGAASLDLCMKMKENDVHLVFSDREFELQLVRYRYSVGIFDKEGQFVSDQSTEESEKELLKRLWSDGKGIPFDRTDWRVEEFMERHPESMSRRTIDVMRDPMPSDEFDLVRNMNMIQYLTTTQEQKELLKRLGRTVKDGGWLIVGKSTLGKIHHGVWQRVGNAFILENGNPAGRDSDDGSGLATARTVLDVNFELMSDDAGSDARNPNHDLVEVTM
jgi:SAM-dependent methyltransferase